MIKECFWNFKYENGFPDEVGDGFREWLYNIHMLYGLIGCNIIMIGVLLLGFNHLPPQIPLFFSKPWGEDQLVDTWMIFLLPILLDVLYFVNLTLYKRYFLGNEFVKKIVDYLNILLMVSVTLIFIKIVTMVT